MGDFQPARIFFLAQFLRKNFFFGYSPMHEFFFCNCIIIILKNVAVQVLISLQTFNLKNFVNV